MPLVIRAARPADTPVIADFNRRMAWETERRELDPTVLAQGVAAVLADPVKGRYLVAEQAGELVGQLMLTLEWSDWRNGWFWWIQSVYVRPDARRQGVFRALYDEVVRQARSQGDVIGLRLYVEHDNVTAQETYRRLGMVVTGYGLMERCPLE
ncbi:MAG: GNAT family N-acetyltransferase [Gemmataceae bacterium]|nr:GNAT family N-acetyltransferase [Gemmataceae bacterium]MDW8267352.1 GNAT family N-acetyltransferase [Gemmataceae bacterium]